MTHVTLVTRVDLRWVTLEFSRILAQFVCLNIRGLRKKQNISIQLQPWQKSGGKTQKTQKVTFRRELVRSCVRTRGTGTHLVNLKDFKPSTTNICQIWFSFLFLTFVLTLLVTIFSVYHLRNPTLPQKLHCINLFKCTYFTFHLRGVALLHTPSDQFCAVFTLFQSGMCSYLR